MAVFGRIAAKWFFCMLLVVTAVSSPAASQDAEEDRVAAESFADVVPADIWLLNDSLKALVEPTQSNTFLVSMDDGRVQAWRKKSDVPLWSFSSGPPLTSFEWLGKHVGEGEEEEYEEDWNDEDRRVSIEEDGSISVHHALNQRKTLAITREDLRQGLLHVRSGEIIQVDRRTTIFLVDLDTGAITKELWNGLQEDLNVDRDRQSLFLIRTDYTAKASNLSGTSLWSLSYGEVGTLVTGLENSTQEMASLSLLPRMTDTQPGIPLIIAPPMIKPAAIVKGLHSKKWIKETQSLPPPHHTNFLALPVSPAPPSLPPPKPPIWEQQDNSGIINRHAPPHLGAPKPASKFKAVWTTVAGVTLTACLAVIINIFLVSNRSEEEDDDDDDRYRVRGVIPAPQAKYGVKELVPAPQAKRRKARKNGKEATSPNFQDLDGSTKEHGPHTQLKHGAGTQVGRLFVSTVLIGSGSNGTLVLEGYLDDRKVAVKRLLAQYYDKAHKEIALLIASDEHPNVVRYYATEETADFVYVSLERCSFSLYDLVLAQTPQDSSMEKQVKECLVGKGLKLRSVEDFQLWDDNGRPSQQLFQVMRDIVAGLAHLHAVGIVHRDLKPHNVLISSGRIMQAKIADMGLSKQLDDDAMSYDAQITGHGSSGSRGWQAPEQLLRGRGSRAVDIFSLGCVLYHCITGGKHPFGGHLERDGNIALGKMDLFHIVDFPEATDLIESLLDPNPVKRPPAQDILAHPFFWDAEKRMAFLKESSDRVELDMKDANSVLLGDIESLEPSVLCGGWDGKFDPALLHNIRGYRRYNFKSVRDLLRVIRNKANHFRELDQRLQAVLGPVPEGIDEYFSSRFPRLLIEIYHVIGYNCRADVSFEKYYAPSFVPKFVPNLPPLETT